MGNVCVFQFCTKEKLLTISIIEEEKLTPDNIGDAEIRVNIDHARFVRQSAETVLSMRPNSSFEVAGPGFIDVALPATDPAFIEYMRELLYGRITRLRAHRPSALQAGCWPP